MKHVPKKQDGLTLLLTVFIVAGITLVAITVSTLSIQGIRNSRASALSEPAIGSAHSGAEEGIWELKRGSTLLDCDGAPATRSETTDNANVWAARSYCRKQGAATFDLKANSPVSFYLYDPAYPNGVPNGPSGPNCSGGSLLDLTEMANGGYQNIQVALPSTAARTLSVYVTRLDGTEIGDQPQTISPGGTLTVSLSGLNSTRQGCNYDNRMQVKLVYYLSGSGSESATITANTDKGIPSQVKIDSVGCAQRGTGNISTNSCNAGEVFNRRINVDIPQ